MVTEFPSNSHSKKRDSSPITSPKTDEEAPEKQEKERVERLVTTEVIKRKKPLSTRVKETFLGGDSRGVWEYVAFDVIVPAAKDMLADAVSQGVERMIFGEARSSSRRTGRRPGSSGYTSYGNRYSRDPRDRDRRSPTMSYRARASHDFDEIILTHRLEAEEVLAKLEDLIERYRITTVADLYDLVGVTGSYVDEKWGWTDLLEADVRRVRRGYLLDLPPPEPIE